MCVSKLFRGTEVFSVLTGEMCQCWWLWLLLLGIVQQCRAMDRSRAEFQNVIVWSVVPKCMLVRVFTSGISPPMLRMYTSCVFHCAAFNSLWENGFHVLALERTKVQGTKSLVFTSFQQTLPGERSGCRALAGKEMQLVY